MRKVGLVMGSKSDFKYASQIGKRLRKARVPFDYRVTSGHKTTDKTMDIAEEYELFGALAGRSDALSAVTTENTIAPVYACRPDCDEATRRVDTWSSLRMPSEMFGPMTVLGADLAADHICRAYPFDDRVEARQGKTPRVVAVWDKAMDSGERKPGKSVKKFTEKLGKMEIPSAVEIKGIGHLDTLPDTFEGDSVVYVLFTTPLGGHIGRLDRPIYGNYMMEACEDPFLVCTDCDYSKAEVFRWMDRTLRDVKKNGVQTAEGHPSIHPIVMDPGNAALAAAKLLALYHPELEERIGAHMESVADQIRADDREVVAKSPKFPPAKKRKKAKRKKK